MNISEVFHNRYELLQKVGSGGFSEVWKANDMRSGMEVAIKIFRKQDAEGISLCREEYLKAFEMAHARIMTPFHFDVDHDRPYLVMKFLHGGTLSDKIGMLTVPQIAKLISQLSEALHYLHHKRNAIIHGDIKPDNILLDNEGNFFLTDFGISTRLLEKFTETMMIPSEISLGKGVTPMAYRSPEHFKYKNWLQKPLSPMSDIWSAGVTLHHVIYGFLPFNGEGGLGQLIMMKSGNHEINEVIDFPENDEYAQFQNILIASLELEPTDRSAILDQVHEKKEVNKPVIKPNGIEINNKKIPEKREQSNKLIYILLLVLIITAAGIGYTFLGNKSSSTNDQMSAITTQQIIEISDDTLEHTGISEVAMVKEMNNSGQPIQKNISGNNEVLNNISKNVQTNATEIVNENNDPLINNSENIPKEIQKDAPVIISNVENKIVTEDRSLENKAVAVEKMNKKTATIKPNIPVLLQLNEQINSTKNYAPGSTVEFVTADDIVSYGDVFIKKGTTIMAEVKKRSDKKLSIRFPRVYSSGGTKLKGLNLDNLEINIGVDNKGKTYRPVTSSYQTNVLIN